MHIESGHSKAVTLHKFLNSSSGAVGAASMLLPRATAASSVDRFDILPQCASPNASAASPSNALCTHCVQNLHPSAPVHQYASGSPLLSRLEECADSSACCASSLPRVSLPSVQCGRSDCFKQYAFHVLNTWQHSMIVSGCAHGWLCTISSPALVPNCGASYPSCNAPAPARRSRAPRRSVAAPSAVVCSTLGNTV